MTIESVRDPVYQYRFFDARPDSETSGQWCKWRLCSKSIYDMFFTELCVGPPDGTLLNQVRVLNVVTSYPTDDYITEHYKVQDASTGQN